MPVEGWESIEIIAGALNHRDIWITKGMYPGIKLPCIPGSDGVGIWQGKRVLINPGFDWGSDKSFQSPHFHILGMPTNGTLAEQIYVPENNIYEAPEHLTDTEAAALPLAGVTAYRALITKCKPKHSDTVLITGIGGGVALFAMQYALAMGCKVYVTSSSAEKIALATELGAQGGVLYTDPDWDKQLKKSTGGIDVVIDSAAGDGFSKLPDLCNPGARIAFYGGSKGKITALNPQVIFWRQISIFGSTMGSPRDFEDMLDFVSLHQIHPIIDGVWPLDQIHEAYKYMADGKQFGKIIIRVQG